MINIRVNGQNREVEADGDVPLLYVLRDELALKGTKYGCGVGLCGICSVLIDGALNHSCMVPLSRAAGRSITTIEGLAQIPDHPVISAWIAEQVPQCGYCQPAQILAAEVLLAEHPDPTDTQIGAAMGGVLCRCGTYQRIRRAIRRIARGPGPIEGADRPAALEPSDDARDCYRLNPFVRVCRDGLVEVSVARTEMGQGAATAIAMLVAEEMEVPLDRMRIAFAPAASIYANPLFGEQTTGGSTSVRGAWEQMRVAGAQAREMLLAAAADAWQVPRRECRAQAGVVAHRDGRRAEYRELAPAASGMRPPRNPPLKAPGAFALVGTPAPRIDVPDMARGRTVYAIDFAVPGMKVAVVARCPVFGGEVAHYDASRTRAIDGVRDVVEIESGIAVVADDFWSAQRGRATLDIQWDIGDLTTLDSDAIRSQLREAVTKKGRAVRDDGNAARALKRTDKVISALYETPYVAHACLEPMSCIADVRAHACDVWTGTQAQTGARATAARVSGVRLAAVQVHTLNAGGGFGRRLEQDFVAEAVEISKAVRSPVQLLWTRDDDLRHDFYRPANCTLLQAALVDGDIHAWLQRVAGPELALGGIDIPYAIPNLRVETTGIDPGIPTGAWRSVGASQNAFGVECFIDELAHAAGTDPLAFRLQLLVPGSRHHAVLSLAATQAGWGTPLPPGRGRGVAVYKSYRSWVAHIAEVDASDGRICVSRVVSAIDCGMTVNPDGVIAQVEGAVAQALSVALKERITIRGGAVVEKNFQDYPMLTLAEMPAVEVHIVPSSEPPGGVGEPGIPPLAPAVANAVFAATGVRLRELPLKMPDV